MPNWKKAVVRSMAFYAFPISDLIPYLLTKAPKMQPPLIHALMPIYFKTVINFAWPFASFEEKAQDMMRNYKLGTIIYVNGATSMVRSRRKYLVSTEDRMRGKIIGTG